MHIIMYGIPNCSTIKKAKDWLENCGIDYTFHNYKKDGIDETTLESWCKQSGWRLLLNQRGTTWKKLSTEDKENVNEAKAVRLMSAYPSMIKRPVLRDLNHDASILVGFDEDAYRNFFSTDTSTQEKQT